MASGLFLGLTLSGLLYWRIHPHQVAKRDTPIAISENNTPAKSQPSKAKNPTASRFDFYTVLSDNEAKADPYYNSATPDPKPIAQLNESTHSITTHNEPEIKPFKPFEPKPFAAASTNAITAEPYILQVGSFRQFEQADKLRGQMALSGYKANIQTFKMNHQETWYRVYIGPFKNRDEALQNQALLEQSHPVHSLIVKFCV